MCCSYMSPADAAISPAAPSVSDLCFWGRCCTGFAGECPVGIGRVGRRRDVPQQLREIATICEFISVAIHNELALRAALAGTPHLIGKQAAGALRMPVPRPELHALTIALKGRLLRATHLQKVAKFAQCPAALAACPPKRKTPAGMQRASVCGWPRDLIPGFAPARASARSAASAPSRRRPVP